MDLRQKIDPSRPTFHGYSRSLELTWIDRLHLFVIHSNQGPISYRLRDKRRQLQNLNLRLASSLEV